MTNYFPIHLNIEFKTVVIVGGGHVATQRLLPYYQRKQTLSSLARLYMTL